MNYKIIKITHLLNRIAVQKIIRTQVNNSLLFVKKETYIHPSPIVFLNTYSVNKDLFLS